MIFSEKLQILRKSRGFTQEELGELLEVSRQAVTRWESGQAYPDIMNLIQISNLFNVTVDWLIKDGDCEKKAAAGVPEADGELSEAAVKIREITLFRVEAAKKTYAGHGPQAEPSRPGSCDYRYERGKYLYIDSYVGSERFLGSETVYRSGLPVWGMNYSGLVMGEGFSGEFLKEALRCCDCDCPFRGPEFYQAGEYVYKTRVIGDMPRFQGCEEIYRLNEKVYECLYHGGLVS